MSVTSKLWKDVGRQSDMERVKNDEFWNKYFDEH